MWRRFFKRFAHRSFDEHPVAHLATSIDDKPHVVPVVFVRSEGAIWIPIDGKPKSGRKLKRVANIEANPQVTVLVDTYHDDWRRLAWERVDGTATVVATPASVQAALRRKYSQYRVVDVGEQAIRVAAERTSSWAAQPPDSG